MSTVNSLAAIGQIVGDPARASMLVALLDGRALTAGELASVAGVTAQTASGHLAAFLRNDMLAVTQQGRHRYFTMASAEIAGMVEHMLSIAEGQNVLRRIRPVRTGPKDAALRLARTCYDHMAGTLAVALVDAMVGRKQLQIDAEAAALTDDGIALFGHLGIDFHLPARRRSDFVFCKPCMDWSERRFHLGGNAGRSIYRRFTAMGWVQRQPESRALMITGDGHAALNRHFGISSDRMRSGDNRLSS